MDKSKDNHGNKEDKRSAYAIPQYSRQQRLRTFRIGEHLRIGLRLKSGKRYVTLRGLLQLRL